MVERRWDDPILPVLINSVIAAFNEPGGMHTMLACTFKIKVVCLPGLCVLFWLASYLFVFGRPEEHA